MGNAKILVVGAVVGTIVGTAHYRGRGWLNEKLDLAGWLVGFAGWTACWPGWLAGCLTGWVDGWLAWLSGLVARCGVGQAGGCLNG